MPPYLPFEQKLVAAWPPDRWRDVRVLVAVSGGPDSVALLRALHHLCDGPSRTLAAAHLNHCIRGERALADQQFVAQLCRKLGVECVIGQADALAAETGGEGLESVARSARYDFLTRTAEKLGARYVVTGHTADDQAETILHHILRGTGLRGLEGMPRVRVLSGAVTLVRPMLAIARADVLAYLAELDQDYCEDETNRDRSLSRNRIRHELMPLLARDYAPAIVESLLRLGTLAGDAQEVIDSLVARLLERCLLERHADKVVLDCRPLGEASRHLVREVLLEVWRRQGWPQQSMGFRQWNELADMAMADKAGEVAVREFPGATRTERSGYRLVLDAS